ncbi:uncharacterized protein LOC141692051 [Apium graveolens]|uniref:uncharacterized protein LOC141692051 n=1 Tax=Apium graveolens TaxID=4045 RepID=UPI003D7A8D67
METRKQTFETFQQNTNETLEKLTTMFQQLVTDVQAIKEKNVASPSGSGQGTIIGRETKPYLKLYFPRFSGDDPTGWIYQAEQYFAFQNVAEGDRVSLASFHLDGIALQWHQWFAKTRGPMSWAEFTKALLLRFGPTEYDDPSESLHRLKQSTTVATYIEFFERLSHRIENLPESFLLGCFVGGLKEEIRLEVKLKKPRTIVDAMGLARLVEEKMGLHRRVPPFTRVPSFQPPSSTPPSSTPTTAGLLGPAPSQRLALPAPNPVRRLSGAEAKERREKGLCYYCDERYMPGHKCSKPQFFMISDVEAVEDSTNQGEAVTDVPSDQDHAEISFHAISGSFLPQTLRLPGKLNNKNVVLLIDGGSTHNFIEQSVVERLGLLVDTTAKLEVVVANREKLSCVGRVTGLTILIQGYKITTDFFVLPIAACPLVLGVQWLKTLGPVEIDFQNFTMGFRQGGTTHKLQGLQGTELTAFKPSELMGMQGFALLLQISPMAAETPHDSIPCPEVQHVLTEFEQVFREPEGLPPQRFHDHHIPLMPGSKPVSSRPYRQPYLQKTEIRNCYRRD